MLLMHMDACRDSLAAISPACASIMAAASSLMKSVKLRKFIEVVLAFGNYMNSQRRGGVHGFKLSAFDRLVDMRSTDKSSTLLDYVVIAIQDKFPDAAGFMQEIVSLEPAAAVSLSTLQQDLAQAQRTLAAIEVRKPVDIVRTREVLPLLISPRNFLGRVAEATRQRWPRNLPPGSPTSL